MFNADSALCEYISSLLRPAPSPAPPVATLVAVPSPLPSAPLPAVVKAPALPAAFPAVQLLRAANHFSETNDFGPWVLLLSGRAIRDLRKLDSARFDYVEEKLVDLSRAFTSLFPRLVTPQLTSYVFRWKPARR